MNGSRMNASVVTHNSHDGHGGREDRLATEVKKTLELPSTEKVTKCTNNEVQGTHVSNDARHHKEKYGLGMMKPSNISDDDGDVTTHRIKPNDPQIRPKQQRLLLLHHAALCQCVEGECKVTPHCGRFKALWKHIKSCSDNECPEPFCVSTKSIMTHNLKCKDQQCPVCSLLREQFGTKLQERKDVAATMNVTNAVGGLVSVTRTTKERSKQMHTLSA